MENKANDAALVELIKSDANVGLSTAIKLYGGAVKAVCRSIIGRYPQDCEECVSDAFAELWRKIDRYDEERGTLKAYVCIIARSLALNRLNKIAGARETVCRDIWLEAACDTAGTAEGNEAFAAIVGYIKLLPPPDGEIMARRFILFEKPSEIAARVSMPKKQIENRLYRERKKLCAFMTGKGITKEAYLSEV